MLRVITARRLEQLEAALHDHRLEQLGRVRAEERLYAELGLVRQALERLEKDRDEWKARASKFIDQVGVSSGILSGPVMGSPAESAAHDTRKIFAAMGRTELSSTTEAPRPSSSAGILGVDEAAARAAISGALT